MFSFNNNIYKMSSEKSTSNNLQTLDCEKYNLTLRKRLSQPEYLRRQKKMQFSKNQLKTHIISKLRKNTNTHILKQKKFKKLFQNKNQSILNPNDFTCPICLQIMISPIVFQCGHFGCLKCIETVSLYQNKCFLCRQILPNMQYNESTIIKTIINKNILQNMQNPIQHYTRLADHINWQKKRKLQIKDLEEGSLVDIKCIDSGKWKTGCVLYIEKHKQFKFNLLIKYTHENQNIEELIEINSSRLAKHGFFTQKRVIQQGNAQNEETQLEIPQISMEFFSQPQNFLNRRQIDNEVQYIPQPIQESSFLNKGEMSPSYQIQESQNLFDREIKFFLNPQFVDSYLSQELFEIMH